MHLQLNFSCDAAYEMRWIRNGEHFAQPVILCDTKSTINANDYIITGVRSKYQAKKTVEI